MDLIPLARRHCNAISFQPTMAPIINLLHLISLLLVSVSAAATVSAQVQINGTGALLQPNTNVGDHVCHVVKLQGPRCSTTSCVLQGTDTVTQMVYKTAIKVVSKTRTSTKRRVRAATVTETDYVS